MLKSGQSVDLEKSGRNLIPLFASEFFKRVQAGGGTLLSESRSLLPCVYQLLIPVICLPLPASEEGSESEGSESSGRSFRNERSIQEKLQVLMAEGLLPAVKVFLDWLRTNPDLIIVCAQVRPSTPTALFSSQGVRGGLGQLRWGMGIPSAGLGKTKFIVKHGLYAGS